eukprot:TRINITY_DN15303_c0_g1_i1.p1 TRINITY_DN15303_c0_g1~~TRINITY_DN15303_c0_g1_i1.p1  ORF type:complete len:639 (-),score=125.10 TRINITY_DN15303_c0_g1_i1:55-1917(-)
MEGHENNDKTEQFNNEKGWDDSDSEQGSIGHPEVQFHSWPFPVRLCVCMPGIASTIFPTAWQTIQDWTHLVVIAGLTGSLIVLGQALIHLMRFEELCSPYCFDETLALIAVFPCFGYICRIAASYDEQIQVKRFQATERKKELTNSYECMINDIDGLLGKASESSATMAERGFESKRREFMRFLDRAESRYGTIVSKPVEQNAMLNQFRAFVLRWLFVFQECSVDPVHFPKLVVTKEELDACKSIGEVAQLTLERLKLTEVRFVSSQRDEDAKVLRGLKVQHHRMSEAPTLPQLELFSRRTSGASATGEIELTTISTPSSMAPSRDVEAAVDVEAESCSECDADELGDTRLRTGSADGGGTSLLSCFGNFQCCGWLRCSRRGGYGCGTLPPVAGKSYPRTLQMKFLQLQVLSEDHRTLLLGFMMSLVKLVAQSIANQSSSGEDGEMYATSVAELVPIWLYVMCIIVLLVRFEEIDIIRRLEVEVQELMHESDLVVKRREQMIAFWQRMQQLTDVWTNRTTPRLNLLKEVQRRLDGLESSDDVLSFITTANLRLESLDAGLPALDRWCGDTEANHVSEEAQKQFSDEILMVCRAEGSTNMLVRLGEVVDGTLPKISDRAAE